MCEILAAKHTLIAIQVPLKKKKSLIIKDFHWLLMSDLLVIEYTYNHPNLYKKKFLVIIKGQTHQNKICT